MTIISAHKSDIGVIKRNEQNEDYVWVHEQTGLFIVADGLGGYEAGDVASKLAANTVGKMLTEQLKKETPAPSASQIKALMTNAIEAANDAVQKIAQQAEQKREMGSTIVVALVQNGRAYISHAGDSRACRILIR